MTYHELLYAHLHDQFTWELIEDENFEISVLATDTGMDNETLVYQWYLNGELVSSTTFFVTDDLDVGTHDLQLVVTDNDGASKSHEMQITVSAKDVNEERELDFTVILLFVIKILTMKKLKSCQNMQKEKKKYL